MIHFLTSLVIAALGGWASGSLLNYLADSLFVSRGLVTVPCPQCGQNRTFVDYIFPRKCPGCLQNRSKRTWLVQIFATILLPIFFNFPPPRFGFWLVLPYLFYFSLVFIMDVEHRIILNEVAIAGAILVIPLGVIWNGWLDTLIGAAAGYGIMLALYYFGILFNKILARRRGEEIEEVALGFGDVNLSGILGLLLGWPKIGISLFFSIMAGGIFSGIYLAIASLTRRYKAFTAIPYAPFLIVIAIVLIYLA